MFQSYIHYIAMGRHTHGALEQPSEMSRADTRLVSQRADREFLPKILANEDQHCMQARQMNMRRINTSARVNSQRTIHLLKHDHGQSCHEPLISPFPKA
ncbi:hypothetical protein D9M71_270090 [compost metagenome]